MTTEGGRTLPFSDATDVGTDSATGSPPIPSIGCLLVRAAGRPLAGGAPGSRRCLEGGAQMPTQLLVAMAGRLGLHPDDHISAGSQSQQLLPEQMAQPPTHGVTGHCRPDCFGHHERCPCSGSGRTVGRSAAHVHDQTVAPNPAAATDHSRDVTGSS